MSLNEIKSFLKLPVVKLISNEDKFIEAALNKKSVYCGFDPSAESLHLGNYIQLIMLKRLEQLGLKPIVVIGVGTGFIGDPSGKSKERNLLSFEKVNYNAGFITKQIRDFLPKCNVLNNWDWLKDLNYLEFLRDFGKYLNISQLVQRELVQKRMCTGLSFTEFNYGLLQAYDFYYLYQNHNCCVQIGGSDQWSNLLLGYEMIRKKMQMSANNNPICALTFHLLLNKDKTKFGKTENNALFLSSCLTPPYQIYQYLKNVDDEQIKLLFYFLTTRSKESIKQIFVENKLPMCSEILACDVIQDIYGENVRQQCQNVSKLLFTTNGYNWSKEDWQFVLKSAQIHNFSKIKSFYDFINNVIDLKWVKSRSEWNRLIKSKAIKLNHTLLVKERSLLKEIKPFNNVYYILQIGKKQRYLITINLI